MVFVLERLGRIDPTVDGDVATSAEPRAEPQGVARGDRSEAGKEPAGTRAGASASCPVRSECNQRNAERRNDKWIHLVATGGGIDRLRLAVDAREHQAPTHECCRCDHVAVGKAPAHLTIGANRPCLDFALHDHVPESR